MNSAQGSLSVSRSTFASNIAFTAGGALAVTERKSVNITNSTFSNNLLFWSDLAAGGGFYCLLCNAVNITSSRFDGNRAAYGGGVALLQPWQASVIFNTSFVRNAALQDPWGSAGQASNRRRVLLAVEGHSLFSGSLAAVPQGARSQAAAVEILGPIAANVTGDSGQYTGGGGLYVSLSNGVRLEQCVFLGNSAFNGGERLQGPWPGGSTAHWFDVTQHCVHAVQAVAAAFKDMWCKQRNRQGSDAMHCTRV
jgi:hypothetical protein